MRGLSGKASVRGSVGVVAKVTADSTTVLSANTPAARVSRDARLTGFPGGRAGPRCAG